MKKTEMLKKNYEFKTVLSKGKFFIGKEIEIFLLKNNQKRNLLGIAVGTKNGKAFQRNRAKRIIRESYTKLENKLVEGNSIVIIINKNFCIDDMKFIDVYEIVCKSFNEAPLSLAFSNYANGEIVQRLNDDRMQLRDGVGYMVRVYTIAPSSIQVKQNLEGMLAALAVQAEQNNSSADRTAVNNALLSTGNTFKSTVEDARVQASLSVIVDKVNSGSMAKDKALKEVYELYKKNPNNDRICENLVTLCDICIMEYIIADKWGASSVKSILDSLNNNKSAGFNRHKGKLAQSYANIWNQLTPENRMLIMGLGVPGTTLNDKGRALQAGINYFKKLGDVRTSNRLGGLGGLFDDLPF